MSRVSSLRGSTKQAPSLERRIPSSAPRPSATAAARTSAVPSSSLAGGASADNASALLATTARADELRALRARIQSDQRVTKLNALVDEFNGFNETLHAAEGGERDDVEARVQVCERTIERLQRNIAAEVEARFAVTDDVVVNLEAQAANLERAQAERLVEARRAVRVDLALTDNRIELAAVVCEQERIAAQRAIERAHKALLAMLLELRDALGVEIAMRIEREALTAQRIADQVFALQELLQGEAGAFQAALGHMRDEHEQERGLLVKSDDAFKHGLMTQLTSAQRALKAEVEERSAVERQLVSNLQDYAGGLVDGLRNVNRRVHDDGVVR
jgi:hypothetical protein